MGLGTAPKKVAPRVPRRHGEGDKEHLTSLGGLAALSLDALSSVAYGPEAIVLVLVAAGTSALRLTLPITLVIAGLLAVLVVSYCQVIAVHPDGGGAYAVGKKDLGATVSLLAAASLVIDYVLTVAVSLAAGAASLASAFPSLAPHLLAICLIGLVLITAVNLWGIAESARALMLPMALFLVAVFGVIGIGLTRSHPVAIVGTAQPVHVTEALGVLLILKAFAAGCSALTGIEAIANGVPTFREPRARRAQRTELMLGGLLALMLIGLAWLIRREHVAPRGGVTVLAQLTAGSFGTGWAYYASNIAVTLVLGLAANTSFGGLPVLMSLLSKDNRLPHLFGLRSDRPVHRYGVVALALMAAVLLVAVDAVTDRLIPMYAIGVFIGFTISQTGLVRHWHSERPARWRLRIALNGTGAVLTAVAALVFVVSKFAQGAWVVVLTVPALMLLFSRIESYYRAVGQELALGRLPQHPVPMQSLVVVPVSGISKLTELALSAALSLGGEVVAVSVHPDPARCADFEAEWARWDPGVELVTLESPHRSLVHPIVGYVQRAQQGARQVAVLIPEVQPRHWRYQILQNQRGLLLATVLRATTDAVVCVIPYRLTSR
ncbi:APC family permease [Streptacidiphilus sp. PB12-B1b]|uniref:APC family permease n=1 Tax=Streptacidiphilus sp. PB12-B1b TaxID=2705012 RepID=UPI0015F87874|nr:APC family permease [Streptacidiphilus sp. PB12-B1b]QMU77683.1 APC family permease [Streptacidiphilus sp. PB12-B1b]